jgi:hypothetical protein
VVDNRNIADAGLKPVFEEGELKIFEMGDPFPYAWFVGGVEVMADANQAIARLASDEFDLRRMAVVSAPLELPAGDPTPSTVTLVSLTPTHLATDVNTADRQFLVFSQIYYPGWQASIDNQPVELVQTNVIQSGVIVPPGKHRVELTFNPRSFWLGAIISGVALLICLVLLIRVHGKRFP